MIVPPPLIASVAFLWGLESNNLIIGVILGLLFIFLGLIPKQWEMTESDSVSLSDLTSVLFIGSIFLIILNVDTLIILKTLIIWQPLVLMPLVAAQIYSGRKKIIIGTRISLGKKWVHKHNPIDFRGIYFAICLLAAAMANSRSLIFYPCTSFLCFWILSLNRGKRFSQLTFAFCYLLALTGGYFVLKGAELTHDYLSKKTRSYIRNFYYSKYIDPYQSHLFLGSFDRLKMSGEIILRIKSSNDPPNLIKLASYETFHHHSWHSNKQYIDLTINNSLWELLSQPHTPDGDAIIEYYLPKEKGLLPHPAGSYLLDAPMIYELQQRSDGITRILDGAPLITYKIYYNTSLVMETDKPSNKNLTILPDDSKTLDKVIKTWRVDQFTNQEKISKIEEFFADGFTYNLTRSQKGNYSSVLENFLFGTQTGHCELFATATTLLLRKVGISSRYVVGYAVNEKSSLEKKYIVRKRHAHAWSEAYINGRWKVVDTTPSGWFEVDNKNKQKYENITDFLSFLKLKYYKIRFQTEQNYKVLLSIFVIILLSIIGYRIYRGMEKKSIYTNETKVYKKFEQIHSPWYQVERRLLSKGLPRNTNEPFMCWVDRIYKGQNLEIKKIEELLMLHNKLRFDPVGLQNNERDYFTEQVNRWLEKDKISDKN